MHTICFMPMRARTSIEIQNIVSFPAQLPVLFGSLLSAYGEGRDPLIVWTVPVECFESRDEGGTSPPMI